jgi:uncharacterized phage protein (TIGR01671 family)
MKESIGLKDCKGTDIREGDIVEFWFSADGMRSSSTPQDDLTHMVDTVRIINGRAFFYCPDVGNGAFAWRFNEVCTVIGNIHETADALLETE